jgi:hypothetical protein
MAMPLVPEGKYRQLHYPILETMPRPRAPEGMQANESLQTKSSIENIFYRLFAYFLIPDIVYRNLGARGSDRQ